jgi:fluoroquinolone resistance protein
MKVDTTRKPIVDKIFTKVDYSGKEIEFNEFDSCVFIECNFSGSNLSNIELINCKFESCDFSMAKLNNTGLKDVRFIGCKLLGIDFTRCKDFLLSFRFDNCTLDYSTFHKKKIQKTIFKECSMKEVDFSFADLTASNFLNCDLTRSVFQQSVLEKVDFRTANNYSFDLELNRIKKAKFSVSGIIGLLDKYQILIE